MSEWVSISSIIDTPDAYTYRTKPLPTTPRKAKKMAAPGPQILYILQCGHVMPGKPAGTVKILCYTCQREMGIKDVHVYEWKMWCDSEHCPYARFTGLSRKLAEWHGNQHAKIKPTHKVKIGYRVNPLAERRQQTLERNGVI